MPLSLLYEPDFVVILPCLPLYELDSALILACYEAGAAAAILLLQLRNSGMWAGSVPLCGLNTASPLQRSAVLEHQAEMQKPEPFLLPRSEACGHRGFRRAYPSRTCPSLPLAGKSIEFACILLYCAL